MVAKMKLIYPSTITNMRRTIMCISHPRIKWGRQMDNTNRKCIFGNDLLQGTQSNVGFPAAVAVGFFGHNAMPLIIVH